MAAIHQFLFLSLAGVALLLPREYFSFFYCYVALAGGALCFNFSTIRSSGFFQHLFLLSYPLLLIVSAFFHWYALSELPFLSLISMDGVTNIEGIFLVKQEYLRYMAYPLFYFILLCIFSRVQAPFQLVRILPLFFIPSLIVGLYQEIIDPTFMNSHPIPGIASGLSYDGSAYGILMFPCILITAYNIIHSKNRPFLVLGHVFFFVSLISALLLRSQKTSILCLGVFLVVFSIVWMAMNSFTIKTVRNVALLWSIPTIFFVFLITYSVQNHSHGIRGFDQIAQIYSATIDEGFEGFVSSVQATRGGLWQAAGHVIDDAPLAGYGPGGFLRVMKTYEFLYNTDTVPKESAANHYLHMTTEIGLIGLILGLIPFIFCFLRKRHIFSKRELAFLLSLNITILVSYISGAHMNSPDVAFVYSLFPALLVAGSQEINIPRSARWAILFVMGGIFLVFTYATYQNSIGSKGYRSLRASSWFPKGIKATYGFYHWEDWSGVKTRWMHREGMVSSKITSPFLQFSITFPPISQQHFPEGIKLNVFLEKAHLDTITAFSGKTLECLYHLPHFVGKNANFSFKVNTTFNPSVYSDSPDNRELGVALSEFHFADKIPPAQRHKLYKDETVHRFTSSEVRGVCWE